MGKAGGRSPPPSWLHWCRYPARGCRPPLAAQPPRSPGFRSSSTAKTAKCLIVDHQICVKHLIDYLRVFTSWILTFSLRASSFSSLSRLRSFSRRRSRCSTANSARVYVRSTVCRCIMPSVHPPRLGTLVNPWHRGKKNTFTWSNVTLPRRALFDFFRMDVAAEKKRGKIHLTQSILNRFIFLNSSCFYLPLGGIMSYHLQFLRPVQTMLTWQWKDTTLLHFPSR